MAAASPIFVSSSPSHSIILTTPPHRATIAAMSSSPNLPSPSQLFANKSAYFMNDNDATSVPKNSLIGFTSASELLRQVEELEEGGNGLVETRKELGEKEDLQNRDKKAAISKKLSVKKGDSTTGVKKARVPRKTPAKSDRENALTGGETAPIDEKSLARKETEKKRKKKSKGEAQTKIGKSRITKPGATTKRIKTDASAKNSKKPDQSTVKPPAKKSEGVFPPGEEPLDLELVEAIRRRRQWTPTKDTIQVLSPEEKVETGSRILLASEVPVTNPSGFENLLGDYAYAKDEDSLSGLKKTRDLNGQALTKKRKVELVNLAVHPSFSIPQIKKPKLPRKKPQTITEKAIAPFMPEEPAAPSLLQYLETPGVETETVIPDVTHINVMPNPKSVRRKKDTTKSAATKNKKKIASPPLVLSPVTAVTSTKNQELIFGTSSQLAREESPTIIKDIRQAIEESELMGDQNTPIPTKNLLASPSWTTLGTSVTVVTSSRNLWSLAARDAEGCLLDAEVVDLVDTPKLPIVASRLSGPMMPETDGSTDKGWKTIELSRPQLETSSNKKSPTKQDDAFTKPTIARSLAEASLKQRPRSRSPVKKSKALKNSDLAHELAQGQMPNYKGFTTVELSKEIATYGFKAIKKRTDMISLLERCWESQNRIALQALQPSVNVLEPPANKANTEPSLLTGSPKKKGRPRKISTVTASGEENTARNPPLKKPRGRPRKEAPTASSPQKNSAPPPQTLPSVPPSTIPRIQASPPPATTPTPLLSLITRAITTFPPTHRATTPTFHEKILLYEPIVLEDLTVWLNTVGLREIGVDDEVGGVVVKEWCEGRGVCCFWKGEGRRAKRG